MNNPQLFNLVTVGVVLKPSLQKALQNSLSRRLRRVSKNTNTGSRTGRTVDYSQAHSNFIHNTFLNYKKHFTRNYLPLVGRVPSFHLNDIKPVRYWKLIAAMDSLASDSAKILFLKTLKKVTPNSTLKQLVRKKLRLLFLKKAKQASASTFNRSTQTTSPYNINTKRVRYNNVYRVFTKRVPTPHYILKWKTSYPLMFTNNTSENRSKKPQLDLTINNFLRPRLNRRTRRMSKVLFKRVKRYKLRNSRQNVLSARTTNSTRKQIKWLSTKARLRRNVTNVQPIRTKKHNKPFSPYKRRLKHYRNVPTLLTLGCAHGVAYYATKADGGHANSPQKNHRLNKKPLIVTQVNLRNLFQSFKARTSETHKTLQVMNAVRCDNSSPTVMTRTGKKFTFQNTGMFMNPLTILNQRNPFTYKFLFKKKIFSFLYPNEVRNSLMNRKKRITFYKLVYKIKHRAKTKPRHALSSFNKFFLNHYKNSLANSTHSRSTNSLFRPSAIDEHSLAYRNYTLSKDEIMYPENFKYRGQDLSFRWSEVKIPRVRFRPGYQRMWRRARTALKESLGLKFVYQQQLTRYLTRFYKGSNRYNFSQAEMSLNRVVMYSRLLPDNPTVNTFMSQKLIYLNGKVALSNSSILVPNDVVQLIVSMWYYITYRWISNWTLKRHKKFKKLVYRKGLAGRQKVMKLKKQRSYYTPNWIYLARYDISDVKPYLEVDYFTLSSVVLYEPFTTHYFAPDETPDFRPTIYRMYNWKYIT